MTVLKAIILGILQGATEFLPVSSSGHLFLVEKILGFTGPELAFDVLLHLGTLLAILLFLRREILEILVSLLRREPDYRGEAWGRRDVLLLIVANVPTAVIGFLLRDFVEAGMSFRAVGISYVVLTLFLLLSNLRFRHKQDPDRIDLWEAAAIGVIQGVAVFPGVSRSGATISLALVLGIGAARSAKFSFFISVPAILGASVLLLHRGASVLPGIAPCILGFLLAFVVGYFSLMLVEGIVTRGKFLRFAPYTFLLAVLAFVMQMRG